MGGMFSSCSTLQSLDLSSFNIDKVTDTHVMFSGCTSLTTIFAGEDWNADNIGFYYNMFANCTSLVGGEGTVFDSSHTDATYARIDGGTSNPGYLSSKPAYEQGDVNMDGAVNVSDVTTLVSIILGSN